MFTFGKTRLGKKNYNVWICTSPNVNLSTLTASLKANLANYKAFGDGEVIATSGTIALGNNSACITFLTGASAVTKGATDGKLRIVVNSKSTGTITIGTTTLAVGEMCFVLDANETTAHKFFPIGVCAEGPSITQKKGDSIKTNDGMDNVLNNVCEANIEVLNLYDRSLYSTFNNATVALIFTEIGSAYAISVINVEPNVDFEINSNGQNKNIMTISKEDAVLKLYDNYTA